MKEATHGVRRRAHRPVPAGSAWRRRSLRLAAMVLAALDLQAATLVDPAARPPVIQPPPSLPSSPGLRTNGPTVPASTNRIAPVPGANIPARPAAVSQNGKQYPAPFARLNFDPIEKRDYPSNPRRDAKGLYVTLYTASSQAFDGILEIVDQTAINALVIDVKDDRGHLLFPSPTAAQQNPGAIDKAPIRDLPAFLRRLKQRQVYTIARIVTFKDPIYAEAHPDRAILDRRTGKTFKSRDGLLWGSPYDANYRAYSLGIAREAAAAGFNEIQFDYIRFPEVGDNSKVDYRNTNGQTKAQAVQSFLLEARRILSPLEVYISADVFGLVCVTQDDMDIGQYWEAVSNAVDYISPMSYPSHYAPNSYGLPVPDLQPYELMHRATRDGLKRNQNLATPARVRPWIQAFTAKWLPKYRSYGVAEIRAQIKALQDQGVRSYLVWNPGNKYQSQRAAFE